jgi:hypothetical protein
MGFNPPLISCYHLFYRSSVLDAVGSQMGFNPSLISCYHPYCRSSVLDPTFLQVVCAGRGGQPDGVQPAPDLM